MRIRTMKPEFFTHPEIVKLTQPARLLFLSLLTQADDEGRLYDQPTKIRGLAFGDHDKVNIGRLLDELDQGDRIIRYEVEDRRCIQITGFSDHQSIDRPRASVIPPFDSSSPNTRRALDEPSLLEGNGREQGKEGNLLARRPDALFESLAESCSIDWHNLTPKARSALNAALAEIRSAGGTVEEIRVRARRYAKRFPGASLTPNALAKHWPALATEPSNGRVSTAQRILRQAGVTE